ncbi:MAG: hypothetical protein KC731_31140 [Myxococcales bacterium]|nr:hypothetical protein [Myxococcales bacterium]
MREARPLSTRSVRLVSLGVMLVSGFGCRQPSGSSDPGRDAGGAERPAVPVSAPPSPELSSPPPSSVASGEEVDALARCCWAIERAPCGTPETKGRRIPYAGWCKEARTQKVPRERLRILTTMRRRLSLEGEHELLEGPCLLTP